MVSKRLSHVGELTLVLGQVRTYAAEEMVSEAKAIRWPHLVPNILPLPVQAERFQVAG